MASERDALLHWGSGIVAVGSLGLLGAAAAVLPRQIEPGARLGRHLVAEGLAIAALSAVEVLIALVPLRRGETWAFWASAVPVFILGLPVVIVEACYVPFALLFATLLPQVLGLSIYVVGLTLAGMAIFRPPSESSP